MDTHIPLVSVIIPVYNAEPTLPANIDSLLKQTYTALELIFVNDCSTDKSLSYIKKHAEQFIEKEWLVHIVTHEENQGVACARNTGLEQAVGDFIYFLDADDYIEPQGIKLLVQHAMAQQADIVGCNWYLEFAQNKRKMNQASFASPLEAIMGIVQGTMRWNLWLFLVKRSLYEKKQIRFSPGMNIGEDLQVMVKLFIEAKRVAFLNKPLYHYCQSNAQSLTKVYSERHIQELSYNVEEVEKVLLDSPFAVQLKDRFAWLKLHLKLPLLISDRKEQYQRWFTWFPEANQAVWKNKTQSLRIRCLQWLAAKRQFWAVRWHYQLVVRFVYGVLYK